MAEHVAKKRSSEVYISVDRLIKTLVAVAKVIGKNVPLTAAIPEINAPVAIPSSASGKAGVQTEFFVPMEVLSAVKDVVSAQMVAPDRLGHPNRESFRR